MLISKRRKLITEKIEPLKAYPLEDAINLLISLPKVKFNESIDISVNLGVDPDKSDQNVRGSSSLPHGIGKISNSMPALFSPFIGNPTKNYVRSA